MPLNAYAWRATATTQERLKTQYQITASMIIRSIYLPDELVSVNVLARQN